MDGILEDKVFAPGYGEFRAHVPAEDELVTVAVAVPTDARRGRAPAELRRAVSRANQIFARGPEGRWGRPRWRHDRRPPGRTTAPATCRPLLDRRWATRSMHCTRPSDAKDGLRPARPPSTSRRPRSTCSSSTGRRADVDEARLDVWLRQVELDGTTATRRTSPAIASCSPRSGRGFPRSPSPHGVERVARGGAGCGARRWDGPSRRRAGSTRATMAQCCSSSVASQPRIALVGKQRLENVHTNGPPGRSDAARPRANTSTGGRGSRPTRSTPRRRTMPSSNGSARVGVEVVDDPFVPPCGLAASSAAFIPSTVRRPGRRGSATPTTPMRSSTSPVEAELVVERADRRDRAARRCG